MVSNWKDPAVIAEQYLGLIKVCHVCAGVFVWEFVSTLDYEWSVYTGKRPFRWTVPIYSMTRCSALGAMICYMIGFNDTHRIDCPTWLTATFTFSYLSLALASGLLAMRAIALWNRNIIVIGINVIAWLVNGSFMIYAATLGRDEAYWNTVSKSCTASGTGAHNLDAFTTMIVDIILLVSMLTGIRRTKNPGTLWKYIYRQGLAWTALATIAEVPIVTLLQLDLNDPMNLIFQPITLTILNIGATRLYRNLAIYATSPERLHPINIEGIECPPIRPPHDAAVFVPMDILRARVSSQSILEASSQHLKD